MELVKQLRDAGKGVEEWRVADPADGSYCISFSWTDCANPEREAREWLEDHRRRFPNGRHAHYEVRRVMEQYRADRLMCQAADEIERLRAALEKIADWHGSWGPFPERNEAWSSMAVVTAREAVPLPHNVEFSSGHAPAVDESAGGCCPSAATQG